MSKDAYLPVQTSEQVNSLNRGFDIRFHCCVPQTKSQCSTRRLCSKERVNQGSTVKAGPRFNLAGGIQNHSHFMTG